MSSHSENNSKLFNKKTCGEKKTSNNMVNCVGKSEKKKACGLQGMSSGSIAVNYVIPGS